MQPTTRPLLQPRGDAKRPRGDESELYARHHHGLQCAVRRSVAGASDELVEDACQNAWAIMLRAQPDRAALFGWLYVVATREAIRLLQRERRYTHLEDLASIDGAWEALLPHSSSLEEALEAREALRALAGLPDRQRRDFVLFIAGFRYTEIAAITGGRTYTNVNKHLSRARTRIRRARLGAVAGAKTPPHDSSE
jgi:RNA polymerase sigma factor (sigma-70 family)